MLFVTGREYTVIRGWSVAFHLTHQNRIENRMKLKVDLSEPPWNPEWKAWNTTYVNKIRARVKAIGRLLKAVHQEIDRREAVLPIFTCFEEYPEVAIKAAMHSIRVGVPASYDVMTKDEAKTWNAWIDTVLVERKLDADVL